MGVLLPMTLLAAMWLQTLATNIWMNKNYARSGWIQVTVPATSSYPDVYKLTVPITFERPFEDSPVTILLGMSAFSYFDAPLSANRTLIMTYQNSNAVSFNLSVQHNYLGSKNYSINYLAFCSMQDMFLVENYIQTTIGQITRANLQNDSCFSSYCFTYQRSSTLAHLTSSYTGLLWITGYGFNATEGIYLSLSLIQTYDVGTYEFALSWHEDTNISMIAFNGLFFIQASISSWPNTAIWWGLFTKDNIPANLPVPVDYSKATFIGFSAYGFGSGTVSWSLETANLSVNTGTNCYVMTFAYIKMSSLCDESCYSCHENFTCILCKNGYDNVQKICNCPTHNFPDRTDNLRCKICHQTCYSCWGPDKNSCTSCYDDVYRTFNPSAHSCDCIQFFISCDNSSICNTSRCYYTRDYTFGTDALILRSLSSNSINFTLYLSPVVQDFANIDFSPALRNLSIACSYDSYYFPNGIFIKVNYFENIQRLVVKGSVNLHVLDPTDPSIISNHPFALASPVSFNIQILPQNGVVTNIYPDSVYNQMAVIPPIIYTILGAAIFNAIIGIVDRSKITLLQMLGVLQISYFGMAIAGSYRAPLLIPMSQLKYSNGYNLILGQSTSIPLNLKLTGLTTSVLWNINIMLATAAVPLLIAGACLLLSLIYVKKRKECESTFKQVFGQYLFTALFFLSYSEAFTFGVSVRSSNALSLVELLSYAQFAIYCIFLVTLLILYCLKDYNYFGEYKYSMKASTFATKYYYLIPVCQRMLIGLVLGVLNDSYVSGAIAIVILTGGMIVVAVKKPYADTFHNQRAIANYALSVTIMSIYVALNLKGEAPSMVIVYAPFVVLVLDMLAVAMSLGFTIKRTVQNLIKQRKVKLLEKEADQKMANEDHAEKQLLALLEQNLKSQNYAQKEMRNKLIRKKNKKKMSAKTSICLSEPNTPRFSTTQDTVQQGLCPARVKRVHRLLEDGLL